MKEKTIKIPRHLVDLSGLDIDRQEEEYLRVRSRGERLKGTGESVKCAFKVDHKVRTWVEARIMFPDMEVFWLAS